MPENKPEILNKASRKKGNAYFYWKVAFNLGLIIIGAVLIALFMRQMQSRTAMVKQQENSELALEEAIVALEDNAENAEILTDIFHDSNQDVLDDMSALMSSGLFTSLSESDNTVRSAVFTDMVERSGADYLFLMTMDGRIAMSPDPSLYGLNPAAAALMTQENVNLLLKGTKSADGKVSPVLVRSQYGSFYFYSLPFRSGDARYMFVLGVNSTVLDVQISSLKDVSVVLSRIAVSNDGFTFAVNTKDGTFLYYKNGSEILTGQSALRAGLSEDALKDGYVGKQTIKGKEYFCVSRTVGDKTIICAVAETEKIISNDRYVLFWAVTGFILVTLLCLAYAIVVRNDFVRHAVTTEKVVINPNSDNPSYFNKSLGKKIFPLMLIGVFVMFGISFYTQTLLEITEGIEKSNVALDEVSGRYDESLEKRATIENYYNNRFLSKGKLIAFLIEEDPSVLNTDSQYYHSVYDKNGNRQYLTDDEGNRIKSVAMSQQLQELCDANDIDSVYIFDENGHTIGTNTPNWFFTVSLNEEDQSYPFRQVLEGKTGYYIQEPMTNDLGEQNQYIGVAFDYYTAKDENGDTVYISRYEYERALAEGEDVHDETAGEITAHHSMLQIGLDASVSEKLLDSTEVGSVLSTSMLSGGFIVMFDTTEEHRCIYSPFEASIGKTADELGVTKNAFTGENYYGFFEVNGVEYFQYFRYAEGYYIATALPKNTMYRARLTIALITSLTYFLLILFLSGTITVTTKEEERLFAAMSEEEAKKGLNAVIFNVLLPSGRNVPTVKAAARWDNRRIPWSEKSPEQKLITMISVIVGILVFYVAVSVIGVDTFYEDNSIVHYILSGAWDRGWNVFAMSSCVLVILSTAVFITLFKIPVRIVSALLGARGETIGHLLVSVVKYGGTLGAFFYCLYLLGIDSSSLLASAGILSLVIGLGAQSLIKDIIAGIFIVFEGEFRVGDIVTIAGFRGTVMDIGLRTTKVLGPDGNIKIFNNSDITGVLNMTQEASMALTTISIEYGQDVDYVEAVLNRDLPKLAENNPMILDGPEYLGVTNLGPSGVDVLVICYCNEKDIRPVTRYLNKGVLQIFYRNGINVPFPNVTFSQLDTSGRKTIDDIVEENKKKSGLYEEVFEE